MKKFGVILADPPWQYRNRGVEGAAEPQYSTMTDDDIGLLSVNGWTVRELSANDSVLICWATWPKLDVAVDVVRAWGFDLVTGFPWVKIESVSPSLFGETIIKPFYGIGFWVRGCSEPILIARRGNPDVSKLNASGLFGLLSPNFYHSRKPDDLYEIAEHFPGPYLELFARRPRPGWSVWGNEIESDLEPWPGNDVNE